MKKWKYDVFVSYAHEDKNWVSKTLVPHLKRKRLRVCLDCDNFEAGQPVDREIESAIRSSRKTILVLTPAYLRSEWTEREHILLTTLDPAARKGRIVPLLLKRCEIPVRMNGFIYLNFSTASELPRNFRKLTEIISNRKLHTNNHGESDSMKDAGKTLKIRRRDDKITICQMAPFLPYLPLYVARSAGFFADYNLDVKITNGGGDHLVWRQVKNGNAHFGVADPIIMFADRSVRGKAVSSVVTKAALWGVSIKSIPPISHPSEFKGKVLAAYTSPSTSFVLVKMLLEKAGLHIGRDVFLREMKLGSEFDFLRSREIDVVFVNEPVRTIVEMHGAHTVFQVHKHFDDFLITGLFARIDYIGLNREVVQRVVSAFEKSLEFIHSDPSETARLAACEFRDRPELTVEIATLRLLAEKILPKHAAILENSWNNSLQIRKTKNERMVSFTDYVDNSFAIRAIEGFT